MLNNVDEDHKAEVHDNMEFYTANIQGLTEELASLRGMLSYYMEFYTANIQGMTDELASLKGMLLYHMEFYAWSDR